MTDPFILTTVDEKQTSRLGEIVGQQIDTGIIITLVGDLGSGKTVFVQGLAKGLAVPADYYITSPTYTLINEYPGRLPFHHVDLYRLSSQEDFEEIGLHDILSGNAAVAIEWADRLQDPALVGDHLNVRIEIAGPDIRKIALTAYGPSNEILIKEIQKICGECLWD